MKIQETIFYLYTHKCPIAGGGLDRLESNKKREGIRTSGGDGTNAMQSKAIML